MCHPTPQPRSGLNYCHVKHETKVKSSVIARRNDEAIQAWLLASGLLRKLIMTKSLIRTLPIVLDCFLLRSSQFAMTATCIVITLFCRGFFPCPLLAMTGYMYRHCEAVTELVEVWLLSLSKYAKQSRIAYNQHYTIIFTVKKSTRIIYKLF